MGSRGGDVSRLKALWWQGPRCLAKPKDWPPDLVTSSTQKSKAEEVKQTRELEVLPNLATSEFLRSLKRLITRRGRQEKIYFDNGKTFVGAEKWLKQVMRDEKTQDYLAHENIK